MLVSTSRLNPILGIPNGGANKSKIQEQTTGKKKPTSLAHLIVMSHKSHTIFLTDYYQICSYNFYANT